MKAVQTMIAVAALAAAGIAGAQMGPGSGFGEHRPPMERMLGGEHGRWWNNPDIAQKLNLTDDQRKAMDDILQQHREKLIDMRANVEKAEVAMEPLVNADQPNESAILAQIDKLAQARAELEKANARFLLALRAKLTPEQWKQLQEIRNERHEHPKMREFRRDRQPGGGPGQPGPAGGAEGNPPPPGPQGVSFQPVEQDGDDGFMSVPEIGTI